MATQDNVWLRVDEYARAVRISETLCRKLLRTGAIPSKRFGRLIRIPAYALTEGTALEEQAQPTAGHLARPGR